MSDTLLIGFISIAAPLAIIGVISFILQFFLALGAPPSRRAAWTAGLAYLIATVILMFSGIEDYDWAVPLVGIPGMLLTFWYWRMQFRRAWFEDPDAIPEGMSVAHDDWRVGLFQLGAIVVLAVAGAAARLIIRGS